VTGQLTAADVAAQLAALSRQLGELVDKLDTAEQDAVNAREDYTLAQAKAFLSAEGAMDVRKFTAIEKTHTQRLAAELAEATVRGLRRQADTVKVRIDVGRSVGVTLRSELNMSGMDRTP
jgi:hypothetical protein